MDIKVYPGKLTGAVQAPPSKSLAHRALICAALSDGESRIRGISGSKDMDATIGCIRALGARVERAGTECRIRGIFADAQDPSGNGERPAAAKEEPVLDCIESGSTLRFLLPVAAALGAESSFTGRGKLPERPMTPLADEMKKKAVEFLPDGRDHLPFRIRGKLQPGRFTIPGNVSSQYISGLLFALPLLEGNSEIYISGKLESASYIALTLAMLREFGIEVRETADGFTVPGGQKYRSGDCEVEGDHSNGAFWLAAGAMGSDLEIYGLNTDSAQGDRAVLEILRSLGGGCIESNATGPDPGKYIHAFAGSMKGMTVDCSDIPDLVPILSVAATAAEGETLFCNAGRLRIKESDRLAAMAEVLTALGAGVTENEDSLAVRGSSLQGGCEVDGHNDHRIVMSSAIAALCCREPVVIRGAEAVTKSYPDFFDRFRELGGRADVIADR